MTKKKKNKTKSRSKSKNDKFVDHIVNHLVQNGVPRADAKKMVCCKICGKTIDQIAKER